MHVEQFRDNIQTEAYAPGFTSIDIGPSIKALEETRERILWNANACILNADFDGSTAVIYFTLFLAQGDGDWTTERTIFYGILYQVGKHLFEACTVSNHDIRMIAGCDVTSDLVSG